MTITTTATVRVTPMMCVISNWPQAFEYQSLLKLSGSQVLNHDLPSESTTTLTRMPIRKMKNAAVPAHTNHVVGEATSERSPGVRAPAFFLLWVWGKDTFAPGVLLGAVCVAISPCLRLSPCTGTSATAARRQ